MNFYLKLLLLLIAFVLVSCEPKFKPNNFVFFIYYINEGG